MDDESPINMIKKTENTAVDRPGIERRRNPWEASASASAGCARA